MLEQPKTSVLHDNRTAIGAAFAKLAAQAPDHPSITAGGTVLTRSELESRTNRLARAYQSLGVRAGSFVTIALPTGAEFLESVLAVWKAGATPQPVSHRLPQQELEEIINLASPTLVVGLATKSECPWLPVGYTPSGEISDAALPDAIAPSLKAPTSGGSTGRPKLIVSTEEATMEALATFAELVRIPRDGVLLSTGPLSHNGPLFSTAAALLTGCHVIIMDRFDAATALELIGKHKVEWMYSVPTMLNRIASLPAAMRSEIDKTSLRTVITMAAHCPQVTRDFCLDYFGPAVMLEIYAATEAHSVTLVDGHGWRDRPGTVGRPVVGEIEVRDTTGRALRPGQIGELWMRRSENATGPYRYIGSDAQRSSDGWETVGDLGHFDEDGFLYLADRKTDMIVVGGINVYPAEVESALEEHPAVTAACAVGIPDPSYGQTVHAVLNLDNPITAEELVAHLKSRIVTYKMPRSFEQVAYPLRDEAGKIRRSRIRQQVLESHTKSNHDTAP